MKRLSVSSHTTTLMKKCNAINGTLWSNWFIDAKIQRRWTFNTQKRTSISIRTNGNDKIVVSWEIEGNIAIPTLKRKILQVYMAKIIDILGDICFLQLLPKWYSTFQGLQIGHKALSLQIGDIIFGCFAARCLISYLISTFFCNSWDIRKNQRADWVNLL